MMQFYRDGPGVVRGLVGNVLPCIIVFLHVWGIYVSEVNP